MDLQADSQAALKPGAIRRWVQVCLAGAALGFFVWSFLVPREVLHSLYFFNSLEARERLRLLVCILTGAATLIVGWNLACIAGAPRVRTADWLSLGLLSGFWPFLNIQALEVFYPLQALCLVIGLLVVLLWISRRLFALPAAPECTVDTGQRWALAAVLILSCGYAAFFGLYTVSKHLAFQSYAFDLGWENQVIYTLLRSGNPRVTMVIPMNPFSNHLWVLFYALLPFYALHPDPVTLLLLQAVLLASGAVPLFLIARKRLGRSWVALVVALVYLLYPALHGLNTYDFHGIVLLIPVVCFLLYFLETGRMRLYWLFFALALLVREDASLSLLGIGLYAWLVLKKPRLGLLSLGVCVGYFLLASGVMTALGGSPNLENYWDLGLPEQQNYLGVALTLFTNPWYVFRQVFFNPDKWIFLLQIFTPVLFLPFFSGRKLLLLVPGLAIILLSGNDVQYSIGFHYSSHITPAVFFLSICGIEQIRRRWPALAHRVIALPLLLAGLGMNYEYGLVFSKRFPGFFSPSQREQTAYSLFRLIPRVASVATISRLYPHLSSRQEVCLLERRRKETEYILVDLYAPSPASDPYEVIYRGHTLPVHEVQSIALEILKSSDYGVLRSENGFLLLQRGYPDAANSRVSQEIRALVPEAVPEILPYFQDPARRVTGARLSESDRFVECLDLHQNETVIIVGNGDVLSKLSYRAKIYLIYRGSDLLPLRPGGSYAAVIDGNKVIFELISNRSPLEVSTSSSDSLRQALPGLEVIIRSVGAGAAGGSFIIINGRVFPAERRGLNLLLLDRSLNVTAQESFATGR